MIATRSTRHATAPPPAVSLQATPDGLLTTPRACLPWSYSGRIQNHFREPKDIVVSTATGPLKLKAIGTTGDDWVWVRTNGMEGPTPLPARILKA